MWWWWVQVAGAEGASPAAQAQARNLVRDILAGGGEDAEAGIQVRPGSLNT